MKQQWEIEQIRRKRNEDIFGFVMLLMAGTIAFGVFMIVVLLLYAACRILFAG